MFIENESRKGGAIVVIGSMLLFRETNFSLNGRAVNSTNSGNCGKNYPGATSIEASESQCNCSMLHSSDSLGGAVIFHNNSARSKGGAICCMFATVITTTRCLCFASNKATVNGSAWYVFSTRIASGPSNQESTSVISSSLWELAKKEY